MPKLCKLDHLSFILTLTTECLATNNSEIRLLIVSNASLSMDMTMAQSLSSFALINFFFVIKDLCSTYLEASILLNPTNIHLI